MDEDENGEQCLECGGPAVPIGALGSRLHFRCRNCGSNQSRRLAEGETAPEQDGACG